LAGSSLYRTLIAEERGVIAVTAGAFYGSDPGEQLTYEATTIGGGPLPPWLTFDPLRLIFTGTPPDDAAGTLDLVVTATDLQQERSASAEIHVVILRDTGDLFTLLQTARANNRQPPVSPSPVNRPIDRRPARSHIQKPPHANRQGTRPMLNADPNRGLSAQLREHALAGRLARARALLNAFGGTLDVRQ
jgi:hypothetical protein